MYFIHYWSLGSMDVLCTINLSNMYNYYVKKKVHLNQKIGCCKQRHQNWSSGEEIMANSFVFYFLKVKNKHFVTNGYGETRLCQSLRGANFLMVTGQLGSSRLANSILHPGATDTSYSTLSKGFPIIGLQG